jgi:acyl-CoA thioesterase I
MKSIRLLLLMGLFWVGGCAELPQTIAAPFLALRPKVKIMPLGDSITQGNRSNVSYRRPLWKLLKSQGYAVDFVGSLKTQQDGEVWEKDRDFDLDHEGHWGWRVDEVLAHLDGWVKAVKPDIALIHLGTNDLTQQQDMKETVAELKQVVMKLRSANPKVKVLMAQVIPLLGNEAKCKELNGLIAALARQITTKQSPVVAVDQFTGFRAEPGKDTYDGAHPNAMGEQKMAQRWLSALKPFLK